MRNYNFNLLLFIALLFISISCNKKIQEISHDENLTNVILLIGDGMGVSQISSMYYFNDGNKSNFSRFLDIGFHQTHSSSDKVTDSAAGATAFSIGEKTYNGAIGVDKDSISRETILEWTAKQNKSTGLISTSSITHATPAAFYAHELHRNLQENIAKTFVDAPIDFAAAGGIKFFNKREDKTDLINQMESSGIFVDTNKVYYSDKLKNKRKAFFLSQNGMPKMTEGREDFLANSTSVALKYLNQNKKGFFLMIEGAQIDWGGHSNDTEYVISEMKDFDQTIGVALDFAEKNGNTLVIVTADHETGGFSLSASHKDGRSNYGVISPTFATKGHSATLIPVFAYGPNSKYFKGIYQNSDIYKKMKNCLKK